MRLHSKNSIEILVIVASPRTVHLQLKQWTMANYCGSPQNESCINIFFRFPSAKYYLFLIKSLLWNLGKFILSNKENTFFLRPPSIKFCLQFPPWFRRKVITSDDFPPPLDKGGDGVLLVLGDRDGWHGVEEDGGFKPLIITKLNISIWCFHNWHLEK